MKLILKRNLFLFSILLVLLISLSVVSAEDTNLADSIDNLANTAQTNDCQEISSDENSLILTDASYMSKNLEAGIDSEDQLTSSQDNAEILSQSTDSIDDADLKISNNQMNNLSGSGDSYYDVYVDSVSQKYNYGKYLYLGWKGYFSGYFKVYDSDWDCVYSEYVSGYDKDLYWSLKGLDVDTYTAALVSSDNYWIKYGTIKITKSSSKVSVKKVKTKKGYIYFYAYVKDAYNGGYYNGGKVKFRINGKNYYRALKNGVAVLKFKVPKKKKKYKAKATFLGGHNVYSSSKTFKFTVKKHKYYKYKLKTKYKTFKIARFSQILSPMLEPFHKKGWTLVRSWYGKKSYNRGPFGTYWDIYGRFKKTYWVKKAKYAYY